MADFHQTGVVTTLHRLNPNGVARVERELELLSFQDEPMYLATLEEGDTRVIPLSGPSDGLRVRPAKQTIRGAALPRVPKGWARTDSLAALEAERRDR